MLQCSIKRGGKMIKAIFAGILAVFLASNAVAGDKPILSQMELRQLFPGNFTAVVNGAVTLKIVAKSNGTIIGLMTGKQDSGRWSVAGNQLCIVWSTWLNGKASCSSFKSGDGWYLGNGVKFRKI
jgi:hypothetical protein